VGAVVILKTVTAIAILTHICRHRHH